MKSVISVLLLLLLLLQGCQAKVEGESVAGGTPPCDPGAAACNETTADPNAATTGETDPAGVESGTAVSQSESGKIPEKEMVVTVEKGILTGLSLTKTEKSKGAAGSFNAEMSSTPDKTTLDLSIDFESELLVSLPKKIADLITDGANDVKAVFVGSDGKSTDLSAIVLGNPGLGLNVPGAGKLTVTVTPKAAVQTGENGNGSGNSTTTEADTAAPAISVPAISVGTVTAESVALSWQPATDNASGDITYQVYLSTIQETASLAEIVQNWTTAGTPLVSTTNSLVQSLQSGTKYTFVVVAGDASGNKSAYTPVTIYTATAAPGAPVVTAAVVSNELAWTAVGGAAGYNLYWSTSSGTSKADNKITGVSSPYVHAALSPAQTYYYALAAVNGDNVESELGSEASATPYQVPEAPTYLVAVPFDNANIDLTWIDETSDESGFEIDRSLDGINWGKIADLGSNVTSYRNSGLTVSTEYHYRVRAVTAYGQSPYSVVARATTPVTGGATYTASLTNSGHFDYECPDYGGDVWSNPGTATDLYIQVGSPGWCDDRSEAILRFTDIAVPRDGIIESAILRVTDAANIASASTLRIGSHSTLSAAMPANFSAAVTLSDQMDGTVSFSDPAATMNAVTDIDVKGLMQKRVNDLAWTDGTTGVIFTIRATAGAYRSFKDNVDLILTYKSGSATALPVNVSATPLGSREIQLNWLDQATLEGSFDIERSQDGVNWTLAANVPANTQSWKEYGLVKSTQYRYRLRAKAGSDYGNYTAPVTVTTMATTSETWVSPGADRYRWDYECPDYGGDVWGQGGFIQTTNDGWCDADAGMYIRFKNLRIPADATVQSAYLELICTGDDIDVVIKVYDTVNPDAVWPTNFTDSITKRANTVADKDVIFTSLPVDHRYNVIGQIVDRIQNASWVINSSGITFLVEGTPTSAYGSRSCTAANLLVTYE